MFRHVLPGLLLFAPALMAAERTHTVTPNDYFTLSRITEVSVSPDGKWVAFAESRWSQDDDLMKGDLWVIATDAKAKPIRLTFDRANDRNVKWSADSKTIYFLGNRKRTAETKAPYDGKTQVWCLPATGGEPRAITKVEGGIDHYDLAPAANALFYCHEKTHHDSDDFAKLRSQYKLDYGGGVRKVSEIHRVNLEDWRTEKVVDENRYVREFAATPDGKRLAMVTAFDDTIVKSEGESRVDIWDAGKIVTPPTDVYRKSAASPHAWLENLAWSPDGSRFAFHAIFDGYPASLIHGEFSAAGWNLQAIPFHIDRQIVGYGRSARAGLQFLNPSTLMLMNERDGKSGLYRYVFNNNDTDKPLDPKTQPHLYGYSINNTVMCVIAARNNELAKMEIWNDQPVLDYNPNPHTASWKNPTISHITWKAPDGSVVGGVLELPHGHDGKTKLPLVIAIHGGPTTSSKAALEFDPHNGRLYFSAAGYAVLCPNYRGSTGYGEKFVTDLIGRENDIEVNDIIAGVVHLVNEGIADPERIGVMGWSNGGYLTNCLITRKDLPFKLKAASSGAGIVDTVAEWGFNDEPAYPWVFKKGHPWETPDIYKKTSPTYDLHNIKTPTIIHVGGNDVRCPPGHSRMLHRAMKEYLNVPCELCEYPGEPHGLGKMTHRKAKMEWDLAWFKKYMK